MRMTIMMRKGNAREIFMTFCKRIVKFSYFDEFFEIKNDEEIFVLRKNL